MEGLHQGASPSEALSEGPFSEKKKKPEGANGFHRVVPETGQANILPNNRHPGEKTIILVAKVIKLIIIVFMGGSLSNVNAAPRITVAVRCRDLASYLPEPGDYASLFG